jgi:hypothetical protein
MYKPLTAKTAVPRIKGLMHVKHLANVPTILSAGVDAYIKDQTSNHMMNLGFQYTSLTRVYLSMKKVC